MTTPETPQRVENYNTSKDPYKTSHMFDRILVDLGYDIQFLDDATSSSGHPLSSYWHMTVDSIDTRNKCSVIFQKLLKYEIYGILFEVGEGHAYSIHSLLDPKEYSFFNEQRYRYKKAANLSSEVLELMYVTAFERSSVQVKRILYIGENRPKQRRLYRRLIQQGKHPYTVDDLKAFLRPSIEDILIESPELRPDAAPLPEVKIDPNEVHEKYVDTLISDEYNF